MLLLQVAVGDMVDVKRGAMSDKSGTVKFIFQGSLFLHSRYASQQPDCCMMQLAAYGCPSLHMHCGLAAHTYSGQSPQLLPWTKRMTLAFSAQGSENTRRLLLRQRTRHARAWCKGKQLLQPWPGDCWWWCLLS